MRPNLLAVLFSVASCLCYAGGAVRQEQLVGVSGAGLVGLARHSGWWWSVVLTSLGAALHVVALRFGPLTVVQPLGALTLVFAVPLSAALGRRRPPAGEVRGVLATVAGLAGLLLVAGSTAPARALSAGAAIGVGAVGAAVLAALVAFAALVTGARRRGLSLAAAAGTASGLASALTQTVTVLLGTGDWAALAAPILAVTVFAPAGLLLAQSAYRYGLSAPLAVVIITNPVAAGLVGVALLGERFTAGVPGLGLAGLCAVLLGYGVVLLAARAPADG